jgi:hypothetical protein
MYNANRILKECFWDYNYNANDLEQMASSNLDFEKKSLFAKILQNSSDVLNDIEIFSYKDRVNLLNLFKTGQYKSEYLNKRYKILRHFILGDDVTIKELKWRT